MIIKTNDYVSSNVPQSAPVTTGAVNKADSTPDTVESITGVDRDRFESAERAESTGAYSPETIKSSVNAPEAISAASTTSVAVNDTQKENIPILLASKMAGLPYSDLGPRINSAYDYQQYQKALSTIKGNHANLAYKQEYCYSQIGGNSYGKTDPLNSCAAFAFATALSIKYGRKITPAQVNTTTEGYMNEFETNHSVWEWKWDGGTAYRIKESTGDETFLGIDAQLQLGNPVLIHVSGKSASGAASQHWATVIGKKDGIYTVIDPWNGKPRPLNEMEIYKNGGASILDYVILTNEY